MVSLSSLFWNRLNYSQKCTLYRLVNNVISHPKEKYLNLWWYQLSLFRREEIINDLMEFSHENDFKK